MESLAFWESAGTKTGEDQSVSCLQGYISRFLKKSERVLLLYPKEDNALCRIWDRAVRDCGCVPLWLGADYRWMTMLKTAFTGKCSCIVGSPMMLLGLSKLSNHLCTPLYVKHAVLAGEPAADWLVQGICQGLDCMVWDCRDFASDAERVGPGAQAQDPELSGLQETLLHWSSILDCQMEKTECGLELELVVFPGEKLPKLPTTAKRVVRAFHPERDVPFEHREVLKNRYLYPESH